MCASDECVRECVCKCVCKVSVSVCACECVCVCECAVCDYEAMRRGHVLTVIVYMYKLDGVPRTQTSRLLLS